MAENKETKYVSDNPKLMSEWNYDKNTHLDPTKLTLGSGRKVWWKCSKGHEWEDSITHRNSGRACPYCSGHRVLKGYNDLQTVNSKLVSEWNYEKNGDLKPTDVTAGSDKKVWWKCSKGHEWQAAIGGRNRGNGCPVCVGQKVVQGYNDLQTVNPKLASEWDYEKNGNLKPTKVMPNSNKKVWWKCEKGHEWQTAISHRNTGSGCPICSGKKVLPGYNDLQTINPKLASEWNYEKNGDLKPTDVMPNSNKKVWWKCEKGHEWQATISHRNTGRKCPICQSERHTSFPEYAIIYYLEKCNIKPLHTYRDLGYELDIYIPSMKIAIEYDGLLWHRDKIKQDIEKNANCYHNGIKLYRLREEGLPLLNSTSIDYVVKDSIKDLGKVLKKLLLEITESCIDVDLNRDAVAIENLRTYIEKSNSLMQLNPKLASEWNYEKNGKLKPENFFASSNKKVWWKCSKGHEWQAVINSRNAGCGCPYCSGKFPTKGHNDLLTVNPTLAKEWNYEMNGTLGPENVLPNSNKKVWWKCSEGHEWQAVVSSRNTGNGCPYCSGRYAIKGENDLQTINPTLSREWNYEKNGDLKPTDVMPGSNKKVWWKCDKGHEWQSTIASRNSGCGCPICAGRKPK